MIELEQNVFMEEIPLPGSPLKALNCFLFRGTERNLIVDLGFNTDEGKAKIRAALRELDFAPEKTDLFLTHMHEDHIGAMQPLREEGLFQRAYISRQDADYHNAVRREGLQTSMLHIGLLAGYDAAGARDAYLHHPASRLSGGLPAVRFDIVADGDSIHLGDIRFTVKHFPGHTMGLCGLWEEQRGWLVAGDHILSKITPNITFWREDFDALGAYLESLKKARSLGPSSVFSSHRALPENGVGRIDELLAHHGRRLEEALGILRTGGPKNALQVAAEMRWDYGGGDFRNFGVGQAWFATGEALAHLEYLYHHGLARRETRGSAFFYSTPDGGGVPQLVQDSE